MVGAACVRRVQGFKSVARIRAHPATRASRTAGPAVEACQRASPVRRRQRGRFAETPHGIRVSLPRSVRMLDGVALERRRARVTKTFSKSSDRSRLVPRRADLTESRLLSGDARHRRVTCARRRGHGWPTLRGPSVFTTAGRRGAACRRRAGGPQTWDSNGDSLADALTVLP
jgi:hypothetical protein